MTTSPQDRKALYPVKIYMTHFSKGLWRVVPLSAGLPSGIYVWRNTKEAPNVQRNFKESRCMWARWAVGLNSWHRTVKCKNKKEMIAAVIALKLEHGL